MPVDPSVILNSNQPQVNPLAMAAQYQGLQNAMSQNALIQQETENQSAENPLIRANTANAQANNPLIVANTVKQQNENALQMGQQKLAKMAKGYLNPDGTVDYVGLQKAALNDPSAALAWGTITERMNNQNQLATRIGSDGKPITTSLQSQNAAFNPTSNALTNTNSAPPSQATSPALSQPDVDNLHGHTDFMLNGINQTLAKPGALSMDDVINLGSDMNSQYAKSGGKQGISANEFAGHMVNIPNGVNPDGSPASEPTDAAIRSSLMQARDKIAGTKAALTNQFGGPSAAAQSPAPNVMPNPVHGLTPTVTPTAGQPAAPGQPAAVNNNGTNTPTMQGPAPGVIEQQQARATQSQARIDQVRQDAKDVPTINSNLDNILNLSSKIQTGAGEGRLADIKNGLITAGISSDKMTNDVSTMQELQKYLATNVQFQGAGGANIPELNALQAANPTDKQLPQTIQAVAQYAKAVQQLKVMKSQAMNNYPGALNDPPSEEAFQQKWLKAANPAAVELVNLPPAQHDAFLKGKTATELGQINDSIQALKQLQAF